jgi:hypothetical protein
MSTQGQHQPGAAGLQDVESASRQAHPDSTQLERFLRGEASRAEVRSVVRHLLTGCPECVAVTRLVWGLAELRLKAQRVSRQKGRSRLGKMEAIR